MNQITYLTLNRPAEGRQQSTARQRRPISTRRAVFFSRMPIIKSKKRGFFVPPFIVKEYREGNINGVQALLLAKLQEVGEADTKDLARFLRRTEATVKKNVLILTGKGLIP